MIQMCACGLRIEQIKGPVNGLLYLVFERSRKSAPSHDTAKLGRGAPCNLSPAGRRKRVPMEYLERGCERRFVEFEVQVRPRLDESR
jgi:hypothetical protein